MLYSPNITSHSSIHHWICSIWCNNMIQNSIITIDCTICYLFILCLTFWGSVCVHVWYVCLCKDMCVYVGGVSEHETLGNVECYDPDTNRWVVDVIPQMKYRRSGVGKYVLSLYLKPSFSWPTHPSLSSSSLKVIMLTGLHLLAPCRCGCAARIAICYWWVSWG